MILRKLLSKYVWFYVTMQGYVCLPLCVFISSCKLFILQSLLRQVC